MKVTQIMMDYRLIQAIQTVDEYRQKAESKGLKPQAQSLENVCDILKCLAFDTSESVTIQDDGIDDGDIFKLTDPKIDDGEPI
jgi:hypothetical protein